MIDYIDKATYEISELIADIRYYGLSGVLIYARNLITGINKASKLKSGTKYYIKNKNGL